MRIKSFATKMAATVMSLSTAGVVAAVPAEAAPAAPLPSYWQPGQYNASFVDLNWLCGSRGQGWSAFQLQRGNPATWRCASGSLIPFRSLTWDTDSIVATQFRWGGFTSDPRTAFVQINAGNDCFGTWTGSFYQPDGW